jgi:TolB-like protein/class 3 adenylate cyclase/Flp pilus assembly protein TadD
MERKLTTILCADVHGYSRLMGDDEEATLRDLNSKRETIDFLLKKHHGRFVNSAGDSVLAEFASVVEAVNCAVEVQTEMAAANAELPPGRRMEFRIGVNLGDVLVDGEQIYGDGVNVAARLQTLAAPGGICISDSVYGQIKNKIALAYENVGAQRVKNIAEPVRVWRIILNGPAPRSHLSRSIPRRYRRAGLLSLPGLAIVGLTILLAQYVSFRPPRTSASIAPLPKPPIAPQNIPSIAVLPFSNLSGDAREDYFSDGITDELIIKLSRLALLVVSRRSSFAYKNTSAKAQDIGRELGVKYLLEGSVRKSGARVRVDTQLVEVNSGTGIWADRFDRPLNDVFTVQDDIVQKIVTTLDLQVSLSERGILTHQTTGNLEAYDNLLRGLSYSWRETKEDNAKALQFFQKAIELDPKYADAYVWIGAIKFNDWLWQFTEDPHAVEQSLVFEQKALALDDSESTAHIILGRIQAEQQRFDSAVAETERGISLAPNAAGGNYFCLARGDSDWAADTLNWSGKPAEALSVSEKAMSRDPKNRDFHLMEIGLAFYNLGRPQEAVSALKQFVDSYPGLIWARYYLAAAYVDSGMMEQAHAQAAQIMSFSSGFSLDTARLKNMKHSEHLISDLRKAGLK